MTQQEAINKAIEYLEKAIDTFPDKDDEIRRNNEAIYGMIAMLHIIMRDYEYK